MRRLLILLLLALPLSAQEVVTALRHPISGGGGGPTIAQSILSNTDGVFSAALPNHAAGGLSCVLAELSTAGNSGAPTLTNAAGYWSNSAPDVSYTADPGGAGYQFFVWCHAKSADASSDTATVNSTSYHGGILFVDIANATAIDASQGNGSGTFSTPTTGSFSLTGSADLAFGIAKGNGGLVVPSGYTSLTASGTGYWNSDAYHQIVYKSVTGSSVNITWNGSDNPWAVLGVAIK